MNELNFRFGQHTWRLGGQPVLMGVLNVTPDSFSDGGRFVDPARALEHGLEMAAAGAAILDVGGESTRPGAPPVSAEVETERVVPIIRELVRQTDTVISIDTWKASVARGALEAGAAIVNDVSGTYRDPAMLDILRTGSAGCVLMHMRGTPATMQTQTDYDDPVNEIRLYFRDALARAEAAGVDPERIVLDPGIGFAKTGAQNLTLINAAARFRELERPILLGPSRKSFIGTLLPGTEPAQRIWGTAAAVACCVLRGADIVRVHDVAAMHDVAVVAAALRDAAEP